MRRTYLRTCRGIRFACVHNYTRDQMSNLVPLHFSSSPNQAQAAVEGVDSYPKPSIGIKSLDGIDQSSNKSGSNDTGMEAGPSVPQLRRRLTKAELIKARENMPVSREPLFRPRPYTWYEYHTKWFLRAVGAYSKTAQIAENARAVWRSVEEHATADCWFESLGIRRTFMTEHAIIALHIWMLHRRHIVDYYADGVFSGRLQDAEVFDVFWKDAERRIRHAGVPSTSINRQLEQLQRHTLTDFLEYDVAIKQDDDNMELAGALFKSVFQADEEAEIEDVIVLADHVRAEYTNLLTQPPEDVYRGWISWQPAVGETQSDKLER